LGRGAFYYVTIAAILLVLSLSANTAFADFPRLCRAIAQNNYLPHASVYRGRRLVYTYGIVVLVVATGFLLIVFRGVTDRLISLYAVGAFLAFTTSQAGMVRHWAKKRGPNWVRSVFINGLGAFVTGIAVLTVLVAKFTSGAWITVIFIPLLIFVFRVVRRHYHAVTLATSTSAPIEPADDKTTPITVVPIDRWSVVTKQAPEFASRVSPEIIALHVEAADSGELLRGVWSRYVEAPFNAAGRQPPALTLLPSPYRLVIVPIVQYVLKLSKDNPQRRIVVVIPQLVESEWFEYFLHNQRGRLMEWALLAQGNKRIFTLSSPSYLSDQR
jgi:Amino acid permease